MDIGRVRQLDRVLTRLKSDIDFFNLLNPVNEDDEREAFLNGDKSDPSFEYRDIDVASELATIQDLDMPRDRYMRELYSLTVEEIVHMLQIVGNLGDRGTVLSASREIYGTPAQQTVERARTILEDHPAVEKEGIHPPSALEQRMRDVLEDLGLDWDIEQTGKATIHVNPASRTIFLPASDTGRRFTDNELQRLPLHEIGVHGIRGENGYSQQLDILGHGVGGYHLTEEGLSTFLEEITGLATPGLMRKYAARVIAVHSMLQDHSFRETFQQLKAYRLPDRRAWNITLRAHRGGGLCKDHIYLDGNQRLWKHIENGGSLQPLYIGKIGLEELDGIERHLRPQPPRYSPAEIDSSIYEYW